MPLVRVDALEGRSTHEIATLLDAVHRALVAAFHIPIRDRYQAKRNLSLVNFRPYSPVAASRQPAVTRSAER
jgi:hypothetical protein